MLHAVFSALNLHDERTGLIRWFIDDADFSTGVNKYGVARFKLQCMLRHGFLFSCLFHAASFLCGRCIGQRLKTLYRISSLLSVCYLLSVFQKMRRIAKTLCDIERTAFTGFADDEFIFRTQRFAVKGLAGILNIICLICVLLNFSIMGRCKEEAAAAAQLFQNGNGNAHALCRVRTGAELVE